MIGSELWSDEPGFEEAVASTGVTGICGSGIIEVIAEMYLAGIINQDGLVDGGMAEKSPRIRPHKRTFTYVVRRGRNRSSRSPRTMCAPSSSPRPHFMPARGS